MCRTIRSNSRCQGCSRGAVFSRKYSRFSCGRPSSLRRRSTFSSASLLTWSARNGPPQIVERALLVQAALPGTLFLDAKIVFFLAGIAVDAVRHQGVRGIERPLDLDPAVPLLALRDIALGEIEIVENSVGVGPLPEQIVVLEKMIVAERRMGDHQGLHGRGIFFHQIGNAGRAVDDDLIGKALQALAIKRLLIGELLAERPMLVEQRHASGGVGIQHLLGGDDLDLVGIDVEPEFGSRNLLAGIVDALQFGKSQSAPSNRRPVVMVMTRLSAVPTALKQIVEHGKNLAAVVDLAHRQRRAIGAQALIQRP